MESLWSIVITVYQQEVPVFAVEGKDPLARELVGQAQVSFNTGTRKRASRSVTRKQRMNVAMP